MNSLRFVTDKDVVILKLNKEELEEIKKYANARTESNRNAGNHINKIFMNSKGKDHSHSEIVGLCGEYAVAKYFNISVPNFVYDQKFFSENKQNIKDVGNYEVKTTHYRTGRLIIQTKQMTEENLLTKYLFCIVNLNPTYDEATVKIVGWSNPMMMSEYGELLESDKNTAWYMEQQFLYPISNIKKQTYRKGDDL